MPNLILKEELRKELKRPLGKLLTGSTNDIINSLIKIRKHIRSPKIICVGDAVSRLISEQESDIKADLRIIDNLEMRVKVKSFDYKANHIFKLINPAGKIVQEAWPVISEALKLEQSLIIVDGEEDLLVLVVILLAPLNSLVLYGQPLKGVVVLEVDKELKQKASKIILCMEKD